MTASLVGSIPMRFRRFVVATAGHVDHGKTSLIRALTGVETDRLPEERRRGISIELGYASMPAERLPEGAAMSFIDVPGHEKLVGAMIAGLGGVDVSLLAVAAPDGVMPQTREHLAVCQLLGVQRLVVAITKADLVDEETLELARLEILEEVAELGFDAAATVATSVETELGIDELRQELVSACQQLPSLTADSRVWLAVDRSFSVAGAGTVVTGTLTRGALSLGQPIWLYHAGGVVEASCRQIQVHGEIVEQAHAPCRVAINLSRIKLVDAPRGAVVSNDADLAVTTRLDAEVRTLPGHKLRLKEGSPVTVHIGTASAPARVHWLGDGLAHLTLARPLPACGGVGLVLRGFSTGRSGRVLGGGRVLDAAAFKPPRRRDEARRALRYQYLLAALKLHRVTTRAPSEFSDWLRQLARYQQPRPLDGRQVEARFGLEPGSVGVSVAEADDGVRLPHDQFSFQFIINSARAEVLSRLQELSGDAELLGVALEQLRTELTARGGPALSTHVLEGLLADGELVNSGGQVFLAAEFERASSAIAALSETLCERLRERQLSGAGIDELIGDESPARVRFALSKLTTQRTIRRLGELYFDEKSLASLRQAVRRHFAQHDKLGVADFKQIAGVSRKQAIVLLEQLDRERLTRRQGDDRVLAKSTAV